MTRKIGWTVRSWWLTWTHLQETWLVGGSSNWMWTLNCDEGEMRTLKWGRTKTCWGFTDNQQTQANPNVSTKRCSNKKSHNPLTHSELNTETAADSSRGSLMLIVSALANFIFSFDRNTLLLKCFSRVLTQRRGDEAPGGPSWCMKALYELDWLISNPNRKMCVFSTEQ